MKFNKYQRLSDETRLMLALSEWMQNTVKKMREAEEDKAPFGYERVPTPRGVTPTATQPTVLDTLNDNFPDEA